MKSGKNNTSASTYEIILNQLSNFNISVKEEAMCARVRKLDKTTSDVNLFYNFLLTYVNTFTLVTYVNTFMYSYSFWRKFKPGRERMECSSTW